MTATARQLGSRFTNREQKARVEVQHVAVHDRRSAKCAAPSACSSATATWRARASRAATICSSPRSTRKRRRLPGSRSCRLTKQLRLQAAARYRADDGRWHRAGRRRRPGDAAVAFERASFRPSAASLGLLYELPFGVVARLNGAIRRARARCRRAVLARACTRRPARSRSAIRTSTRRRRRPSSSG